MVLVDPSQPTRVPRASRCFSKDISVKYERIYQKRRQRLRAHTNIFPRRQYKKYIPIRSTTIHIPARNQTSPTMMPERNERRKNNHFIAINVRENSLACFLYFVFCTFLESRQPRTNAIRDKCSNGSESKRLKSRKNRRSMREVPLEYTNSCKGYTCHQARELKCPNIKYIRNQWYKSHNHKRHQRPESNRERSFFTNFLTLGSEIGTDRHRCSIRKEIGQTENNNRRIREITSRRTSNDCKGCHCSINGSIHHLRKIMAEKIKG